MTNYDNSVIYKICCKDEAITDVYVGSTVNPKNRKHSHKSICNNKDSEKYNFPVYRYIRDHGGWDNWQFVLLEKFPCKDKQELSIRERYWFEMLGARLNSFYPQRSKKEYDRTTKKEYYARPEVKERQKERHKQTYTCLPCNKVLTKGSKWYHERTNKHLQNLEKQQIEDCEE